MNVKELQEKRKALLKEVTGATEERFAEIRSEVAKIDFQIANAGASEEETRARREREADARAARDPNPTGVQTRNKVVLFDSSEPDVREAEEKTKEAVEKRAKTLRAGGKIKRAAVTSAQTALATKVDGAINPAFEQVGTIDTLVNPAHMEGEGAESYKKAFVKSYGTGEIGSEGAAANGGAEPVFDYATIQKIKITAYAEITEEVEKLPEAAYIHEVERAVMGAWRRKLIDQIINGSGNNQMVGIIHAPETIIEESQRKTIATIDENTLDEIIFSYGGDENVEGDAHLILNKLTLKKFATVKGSDKKRAYDIVVRGNGGTINGIPFVCTSRLPAFDTVSAGKPYLLYGKLKGYELAYFTQVEIEKSKDYKFKEGMIAYKATGYVGGSPAALNVFMSVQKATAAE